MLDSVALFVCGLLAWTFLEYLIHGWLGHLIPSFVSPIHWMHHREPRAVFAVGAWIPLALLWTLGLMFLGLSPWMIIDTGALTGFALYEALHYRIHFCAPRNELERGLRTRHLAHHGAAPNQLFGVSSPLWDLAFGTEPLENRESLEQFSATAPLTGRSNLRLLWQFDALRHRLRSRHL